LLAALTLWACDRPNSTAHPPTTGCIANADTSWTRTGGPTFDASASTTGADCAHAVATIAVRDAYGVAACTEAFPANQVMVLAHQRNAAAMQGALVQWIDQSNPQLKTTGDLPEWPVGATSPTAGEFPFYPDASVNRDAYIALRTRKAPLFCFVQGQ